MSPVTPSSYTYAVVYMVVPDSSEVSGSDSEPLPDPEPPLVSLLSRLKAPTTSDKRS